MANSSGFSTDVDDDVDVDDGNMVVVVERGQTKSCDKITGMHPAKTASYMRLAEGESPPGHGQKVARRIPTGKEPIVRWKCHSCDSNG